MEDVVEGGILVGEQVVFARHTNPVNVVRRDSNGSIKKYHHRKSVSSANVESGNEKKCEGLNMEDTSCAEWVCTVF